MDHVQHAATFVLALAMKLLAVVLDAIGMVEGFLRHALESVGIDGPVETLTLVFVGVLLVIAAFQIFGRLFLLLLAVFVLLLAVKALLPGAPHPPI